MRISPRVTLTSFGDLFHPEEAVEPILAKGVRAALLEWLTEIWAEKELAEVGIGPRKRAIFSGPPGVGKTTLAHHLSARLGLPMLAVRPECIISKWVGETGQNIGVMFELARRGLDPASGDGEPVPVVLLLDEFDSYSRQRRRAQQAADDSRNEEVNTMLQRIEQHDGFLIAVTNFADHIDQAIWRRFDIHITLDLPGQFERERIIARYLAPYGLPSRQLSLLGESFETASPALIRAFCENLKRTLVVGPKMHLDMSRSAVIDRVLNSIHPHPDCGKPKLWSLGAARDVAVNAIDWPLRRLADITETPTVPESPPQGAKVIELRKGAAP